MNDEQADTVLPLPLWIAILAILFCWPSMALSAPMFAFEGQGVRIVLTDDKCEMSEVTNLPYRVTWTEKGKTTDGCWGIAFDRERVNILFADKTVVSFPPQAFTKVTGV